jgi:hypothetical protein
MGCDRRNPPATMVVTDHWRRAPQLDVKSASAEYAPMAR